MDLLNINITPLNSTELDGVMELDRLSLGGVWTLEQYQRELFLNNSCFLKISFGTEIAEQVKLPSIIGLGGYRAIAKTAKISLLAIHPDYQQRGLGQLLLFTLLKQASEEGLRDARLEVRESNQPAISLYKKFGFQMVEKIPNYYTKFQENGLIFHYHYLSQPEFKRESIAWQQEINQKCQRLNVIY